MNTQPEALRLAGLLETDGWPDAAAELRRLHEENQALRQALAMARFSEVSQEIEEALKQEPVAWMHTMIDDVVIGHRPADIDRHPDRWTALYSEPKPCPTCEALARTVMMDQTAHDTPPAQRAWVGLTDEEIYDYADKFLYQHGSNYGIKSFGKAIEAKLKEKNT